MDRNGAIMDSAEGFVSCAERSGVQSKKNLRTATVTNKCRNIYRQNRPSGPLPDKKDEGEMKRIN